MPTNQSRCGSIKRQCVPEFQQQPSLSRDRALVIAKRIFKKTFSRSASHLLDPSRIARRGLFIGESTMKLLKPALVVGRSLDDNVQTTFDVYLTKIKKQL